MTNADRRMMKLGLVLSTFLACLTLQFATAKRASAQLWHSLPPVSQTIVQPQAQFSNDQKKVFYLSGTNGVENIWSSVITDKWGGILPKPGSPVQITKFTDRGVVRFFHLLGSPDLLYMRATDDEKDYHIYRMADNGSGTPQDLTPGPDGVTNIIIGASYNGRYVYYTSNKVNRDKTDVYQYDTQQNLSENVFPNDKDYVALAWTRDQTKLLMELPSTGQLSIYDMETTDRQAVTTPNSDSVIEATLDPVSQDFLLLTSHANTTAEYGRPFTSGTWKQIPETGADWIDFSPNGKYEIVRFGSAWQVRVRASMAALPLPAGSIPLEIDPKETLVLYFVPGSGSQQLFLYDIPKKSSTPLASLQ